MFSSEELLSSGTELSVGDVSEAGVVEVTFFLVVVVFFFVVVLPDVVFSGSVVVMLLAVVVVYDALAEYGF